MPNSSCLYISPFIMPHAICHLSASGELWESEKGAPRGVFKKKDLIFNYVAHFLARRKFGMT